MKTEKTKMFYPGQKVICIKLNGLEPDKPSPLGDDPIVGHVYTVKDVYDVVDGYAVETLTLVEITEPFDPHYLPGFSSNQFRPLDEVDRMVKKHIKNYQFSK